MQTDILRRIYYGSAAARAGAAATAACARAQTFVDYAHAAAGVYKIRGRHVRGRRENEPEVPRALNEEFLGVGVV